MRHAPHKHTTTRHVRREQPRAPNRTLVPRTPCRPPLSSNETAHAKAADAPQWRHARTKQTARKSKAAPGHPRMRIQPSPVTVEVSDSEEESASEAPPPASPSAAAQDSPGPRARAFTLSPAKAPLDSDSADSSDEVLSSSDDDAAQPAPAQADAHSGSDAENIAEPTAQDESDSSESEATDSSSEEMPRVRPDSARTWCTQCTTARAFRHTTTTFLTHTQRVKFRNGQHYPPGGGATCLALRRELRPHERAVSRHYH